jgi:hypothetical protein
MNQFEVDMTSWDHHVETIRGLAHVDKAEKHAIMAGFLGIRDVLGANWLSRSYYSRSPIIQRMINRAPWVWRSLAAFGRQLLRVRQCPGFASVVPRLSLEKECLRAASQVRFASQYVEANVGVTFEPPVGTNRADLLVNASPDHYIELKMMDPSDDQRDESELIVQVVKELIVFDGFTYDGVIFKLLSQPHLNELITKIKTANEDIRQGKAQVHLHESGAYDIVLQKKEPGTNQVSGLRGPPSSSNEIRRLRRTVHDAAWKQLPANEPSLLFIHDQASELLAIRDKPDLLVEALDETVYEHPNLVAVAVTFGWLGGGDAYHADHGHYQIFRRRSFEVLAEAGVIIKNRYGKFPFREDVLRPIVLATE